MNTPLQTQGTSINPSSSSVPLTSNSHHISVGESVNAGAPASGSWTDSLSEDARGYVQTKGFKDPASVLESYRNLEKLRGVPEDRLLKLPKEADKDAWGEVYSKLGRPKEASEYKFDSLGDNINPDFIKGMSNAFHEAGLNQAQTEKILSTYKEFSESLSQNIATERTQSVKAQESNLKAEWGAAFDKNVNVARKAAHEFGLDATMVTKLESALGLDKTMMLLKDIGSKLGEDSFVAGNSTTSSFGNMEPAEAKHRIASLKNDKEFIGKIISGNADAKNEWERLHKYAFGG
jgi:hypothetical protein